jgi:hypothetical protein
MRLSYRHLRRRVGKVFFYPAHARFSLGAIAKTVHFDTLIVKMVHFLGLYKNDPLFSTEGKSRSYFVKST